MTIMTRQTMRARLAAVWREFWSFWALQSSFEKVVLYNYAPLSKYVSFPGISGSFECLLKMLWFVGMVNVIDRRCQEPACKKFPSHNYPGMHKKIYCASHKKEGMVGRSGLWDLQYPSHESFLHRKYFYLESSHLRQLEQGFTAGKNKDKIVAVCNRGKCQGQMAAESALIFEALMSIWIDFLSASVIGQVSSLSLLWAGGHVTWQ